MRGHWFKLERGGIKVANKAINKIDLNIKELNFLASSLKRKLTILEKISIPKNYFLQISEFYNFLIKNDTASRILNSLLLEYQKELEPIEILREKVEKETTQVFVKVEEIIIKNNILGKKKVDVAKNYFLSKNYKEHEVPEEVKMLQRDPVGKALISYYQVLYEATQGSLYEEMLCDHLHGILRTLHTSGNTRLIKKYIEYDKKSPNKTITRYKVSPSIEEWLKQRKITLTKLESHPWFAYKKIKLVPLCVYDYVAYHKKLCERGNMVKILDLNFLCSEMKKILENRISFNEKPRWFIVNDYQIYVERLYDAFLSEIHEFQTDHANTKKIDKSKEAKIPDTENLSKLIKKRPTDLPVDDIDPKLRDMFDYKLTEKGDFTLRYGIHEPIYFEDMDLGCVMQVFAEFLGSWINYETIHKCVWTDEVYKEEIKEKGKPPHRRIRQNINDIRSKKLKPRNLDQVIIFQKGRDFISKKGEGWFRLFIVPS